MAARSELLPTVGTPPAAAFTRALLDGASLYGVANFDRGRFRLKIGQSTSAAVDPPGPTCEEIGYAFWHYAERTLTG